MSNKKKQPWKNHVICSAPSCMAEATGKSTADCIENFPACPKTKGEITDSCRVNLIEGSDHVFKLVTTSEYVKMLDDLSKSERETAKLKQVISNNKKKEIPPTPPPKETPPNAPAASPKETPPNAPAASPNTATLKP